jgi:hypothetical protein
MHVLHAREAGRIELIRLIYLGHLPRETKSALAFSTDIVHVVTMTRQAEYDICNHDT